MNIVETGLPYGKSVMVETPQLSCQPGTNNEEFKFYG